MFSKKELIIFAAGAEAFHTLSHVVIQCTDILPITIYSIQWTPALNILGIVVNAAVTVALLRWASKTK